MTDEGKHGPQKLNSVLPVLESVASIIKTITWPLILIFVFVAFRQPLIEVSHQIPLMLAQANKVSAAGLTIEIRRTAQAVGDPELADLISGLSKEAVRELLNMPRGVLQIVSIYQYDIAGSSYYLLPDEISAAALRELQLKGLIDPGVNIDDWYVDSKRFLEPMLGEASAGSGRSGFRPKDGAADISKEDLKRLLAAMYRISERGNRAITLIINSVVQELQRSSPAEAELDSGTR